MCSVAPNMSPARINGAEVKSTPWCSDTVAKPNPLASAHLVIAMASRCIAASVTVENGASRMSNRIADTGVTSASPGRWWGNHATARATRPARTGARGRVPWRRIRPGDEMARRIASIEDVRAVARRRVPRMVFDYVDSGARAELTIRANRAAFDEVVFNPRMAAPATDPDLSTTVLGTSVTMPLLLSPCGGLRAVHPHGEAGAARAAQQAGTVFTLSSASGMSIEHVAAHAPGPRWFQLYFLGGRAGAERLVERAASAGYGALVVTVDTIVPGVRERDVRNGMTSGPYVNARNIVQFAPHVAVRPRWLWNFVRDGFSVDIANAATLGPGGTSMSATDASMGMFAEPPTWDDIVWIRDAWRGPLVVKGVLTADDTRRAVDLGADGVVVSNHGGRQLDERARHVARAARGGRRGGRAGRGAPRQWRAARERRDQGRCARGEGRDDRPGVRVRPRRGRRAGSR